MLDTKKLNVLKVVPYMTPVEVIKKIVDGHPAWSRVILQDGGQGYMYSQYLKFISESLPPKKQEAKKQEPQKKVKKAVKSVKKHENPLSWSQIVARHFDDWDKNLVLRR